MDETNKNNHSSNWVLGKFQKFVPSGGQFLDFLTEFQKSIELLRDKSYHRPAFHQIQAVFEWLSINWSSFNNRKFVLNEKQILSKLESDDLKLSNEDKSKIIQIILQLTYEMSILFYYVSKEDKDLVLGSWVSDITSLHLANNEHLAISAFNNNLFYIRSLNLPSKKEIKLEINMPYLFEGSTQKYRHSNPSIVSCGQGYLAIIRGVNYHQVDGLHFTSLDPDGIVRTQNFLVGLNSDYQILWSTEIVDKSTTKRYETRIRGLEDCRLFSLIGDDKDCPTNFLSVVECLALCEDNEDSSYHRYGVDFGKFAFTCVTCDTRLANPQVSVCRLSSILTADGKAQVIEICPLIKEGCPDDCEKNWLPFFNLGGEFRLIYSYQPLILLNCPPVDEWKSELLQMEEKASSDEETTISDQESPENSRNFPIVCQTVKHVESPLRLGVHHGFRGSGGPLKCQIFGKDGYLVAVHGVILNGKRYYHTRLLFFGLDWKLIGISPAFYSKNNKIEYCAAITFNLATDKERKLVFTMGVEDREAWLISYSWKEIQSQMLPIDSYSIHFE